MNIRHFGFQKRQEDYLTADWCMQNRVSGHLIYNSSLLHFNLMIASGTNNTAQLRTSVTRTISLYRSWVFEERERHNKARDATINAARRLEERCDNTITFRSRDLEESKKLKMSCTSVIRRNKTDNFILSSFCLFCERKYTALLLLNLHTRFKLKWKKLRKSPMGRKSSQE